MGSEMCIRDSYHAFAIDSVPYSHFVHEGGMEYILAHRAEVQAAGGE